MQVQSNSSSFEITDLHYGQEISIAVDGVIAQKFNIQQDKAKVSVYVNKVRSPTY